MPEVSDSESDGDTTKRRLNTQHARLFAAAAPTVPTSVAQAGNTSSADIPPVRRQRLEGVVHTFGKNSVKSKNGHRWSAEPPNAQQFCTAQHNIINSRPGPSLAAAQTSADAQTSLECFHLFITDNSVDHIVRSTNDVITGLTENYVRQDATVGHVTSNEVRALIGVLIFSGSNQDNHKSTKLTWSPKFGLPVFRAAMSLFRFNFLSRAIRFDGRSTREERVKQDKFAAIRKLWDDFIAQCVKSYISGPHVTVEEHLLAFRGRCAFKMYIANKPAKYGIKLVMACDAESKYM